MDRTVEPIVYWDVWVDQCLDREVDRGEQRGAYHVDWRPHLRRCVGEGEENLAAHHRHLDPEIQDAVDQVAVEPMLESVSSVGDFGDPEAGAALGVVE